jgi:AraC-like DNA-binding protein
MANFDTINPKVRMIFTTRIRQIDKEITHHKLSLTYRFLILLQGSFCLRYNGNEEICRQGDVIYMPPRQEYETVFYPGNSEFMNVFFDYYPDERHNTQGREPTSNFFIMTDYEILDPAKYTDNIDFTDMPDFNKLIVIKKMPDSEIKSRELYRLYNDNSRYSRMRLNARCAEFIADAAEYVSVLKQNPSRLTAKTIVSYINGHYNEGLTCHAIAEHFSYHPNYVNRIVRDLTGLSLHDYIVAVKIQHANQLLLETDMTITDIAYYLAFHDSSHFSSVYFAQTGMKPSDRRRLLRESNTADALNDEKNNI